MVLLASPFNAFCLLPCLCSGLSTFSLFIHFFSLCVCVCVYVCVCVCVCVLCNCLYLLFVDVYFIIVPIFYLECMFEYNSHRLTELCYEMPKVGIKY